MCKPAVHRRAAGLLFFLMLVVGCSAEPLDGSPPTIPPATPAGAPPVTAAPAGVVQPLTGRGQAAIVDDRTAALAVLTAADQPLAPASLAIFDSGLKPARVIELPGPVSALTGDDAGNVYMATRGGYFVVDLVAGRVTRVTVADAADTDFTAIARRADDALVLGTADGAVYALAAGNPEAGKAAVTNRTKIVGRVDALAAQGNTVAVLDRAQTLVTTIEADGTLGQALRAGQGATTIAADPQGRLLVADTRGGQLLVFGVDPLILRQAYPVRQAPYGLAGSRGLTWVTQTAANMVIGYDLSTGIPVEKVRYPTVQQPNSLAVADASGTLYVVSGSGGGVQVIEHAAGPR
ncbi:hypothetical protein A5707_12535 [Mycobacterium kyorinense]|uniref:SMP-30/Gluconolactonase/LRE-like region domain-containing protein n=1 Tax=Mycobacterium kyorinense TaxID=487514 RepID=A0A1A2ZPH9_9MYCO|nr:hypothetical protein A5707_12535 [Mycobacterium kyorinense]